VMKADLAFAEIVLADLRRAWAEFNPDQKRKFQTIVFPGGLAYGKKDGYGTPV